MILARRYTTTRWQWTVVLSTVVDERSESLAAPDKTLCYLGIDSFLLLIKTAFDWWIPTVKPAEFEPDSIPRSYRNGAFQVAHYIVWEFHDSFTQVGLQTLRTWNFRK